jgi:hypothetical protein
MPETPINEKNFSFSILFNKVRGNYNAAQISTIKSPLQ